MPGTGTQDQRDRKALRKECYLKKKRGMDAKFKEDMPEGALLGKWPKFLDLQVSLPDPGETAALVEMRNMCPGKSATLEKIEEACQETRFRTPFWKGKTSDTDMPGRILSPAEVDVINKKYLELQAAFDAKRQSQAAGEAIAEAEQNLTAQNLKAQELIVEVRRELNAGLTEIKGLVKKKKTERSAGSSGLWMARITSTSPATSTKSAIWMPMSASTRCQS